MEKNKEPIFFICNDLFYYLAKKAIETEKLAHKKTPLL